MNVAFLFITHHSTFILPAPFPSASQRLRGEKKNNLPSIHTWDGSGRTLTYEPYHGGDCETVHYRAIHDDKGRMMVIICHNTDLGDGWEREAEDPTYFEEFSEKLAYPMGINIVTYAMTH